MARQQDEIHNNFQSILENQVLRTVLSILFNFFFNMHDVAYPVSHIYNSFFYQQHYIVFLSQYINNEHYLPPS